MTHLALVCIYCGLSACVKGKLTCVMAQMDLADGKDRHVKPMSVDRDPEEWLGE